MAPRKPIRAAQMRVTCRSLSRKRSMSQTLIFSKRRNNGESCRACLSSSLSSMRFGKCGKEAGEIFRIHESADRLLSSNMPSQERNNFEVFSAGMLWNTDQEDQSYHDVSEQDCLFAGCKNHDQGRNAVRARVRKCDAARKQGRVGLLTLKNSCCQLFEIFDLGTADKSAEHLADRFVVRICLQIFNKN